MSTVFAGLHTLDGSRVAVKILRPLAAGQPSLLKDFAREVRGVARCEHACVTAIHDYGIITPEEAGDATAWAGAPWLAMEFVEGYPLSRRAGQLPWHALRKALRDTLAGLSHAHAIGLLHRDIKPGNLLCVAATGQIKLTDFGLVSTPAELTRDCSIDIVHGTPAYMAPEQVLNDWSRFGPWTDLYALGATAWKLVTGASLFAGSPAEVLRSHLTGDLPPFVPAIPVPSGFHDWLLGTLARDPADRFVRASDASWALASLPETPQESPSNTAPRPPNPSQLTLPSEDTLLIERFSTRLPASGTRRVLDIHPRYVRPPCPPDWREERATPSVLPGAGLNLVPVKSTGMVGRSLERDRLWSLLRAVIEDQQPAGLLLEGPAGSGKATLTNWLTRRAYEVGAAQFRYLDLSEGWDLLNVTRELLGWTFWREGSDAETVLGRLRKWMPLREGLADSDLAVLAEASAPTSSGDPSEPDKERIGSALIRLLRHLSTSRPLILRIDGLAQGEEAIRFITRMLEAAPHKAVLFIGIVCPEEVRPGSSPAFALEALEARPDVEKILIRPLERAGLLVLLREKIGLAPQTAARLEQACGGNPQVAVEMTARWVRQDLLVPSRQGFLLREGSTPQIPPDLLSPWQQRLQAVLGGQDPRAIAWLEIGAVLGQHLTRPIWEEVMRRSQVTLDEDLFSALIDARLIFTNHRDGMWDFLHALSRAAVLEHARRSDRLEHWSRTTAEAVRVARGPQELLAHLRLETGEPEEAAALLARAALREATTGDRKLARHLAAMRQVVWGDRPQPPRCSHALDTALLDLYLQPPGQLKQALLREGPALLAWSRDVRAWGAYVLLQVSLEHLEKQGEDAP